MPYRLMRTIVLSLHYLLVQLKLLMEANNYKPPVLVALVIPKNLKKKEKEEETFTRKVDRFLPHRRVSNMKSLHLSCSQ